MAFVASTSASSDFKKIVFIFITGVNRFSYSAYPSLINFSPPLFLPTIRIFVVRERAVLLRVAILKELIGELTKKPLTIDAKAIIRENNLKDEFSFTQQVIADTGSRCYAVL